MQRLKKFQKISLRVFAILSGFLLWLYVLSSAQTKIEKKVNIHFILPEHHAVINHVQKEITYTLEGPRALVRNLLNRKKNIKINIKNIYRNKKKKYEIAINNIGMNFPFGVKVLSVEPRTLTVELDKKLTKKIPVILQSIGKIPSDHKLIQETILPKSITVSGPESLVRKIKEVKTLPISLNNITQSDSKKLSLYLLDDRVKYSQYDVDYQFEVQPTRANLLIKNVPISFLTTRNFGQADRRSVNLMVLAENGNEIENKKREIKIIAEIPERALGEVEIPLSAKMPEGLHLLEIIPSKVKVKVKR